MEELQLSGGDPLLYPHLIEVIEAARRHGAFVLMNSVGTGVTVERAKEIIDAGLGAWNFSVDTLDPAKYEQLRGVRNALPTIMKAIEAVRQAGVGRDSSEFRMNYMTVITRANFREIPRLVTHCLEGGIASIYLMNVYGDTTGASLLTVEEIGEFRDEVAPAVLAALAGAPQVVQDNAARVMGSFFSRENPDENYAAGLYWPDDASVRKACQVPEFYTLIEPDGRALPCCLVEISHQGEVGNVMDRPLAEVWTGQRFEEFRKKRIPFCRSCSSPRNMTLGLIPSMCRQFRP